MSFLRSQWLHRPEPRLPHPLPHHLWRDRPAGDCRLLRPRLQPLSLSRGSRRPLPPRRAPAPPVLPGRRPRSPHPLLSRHALPTYRRPTYAPLSPKLRHIPRLRCRTCRCHHRRRPRNRSRRPRCSPRRGAPARARLRHHGRQSRRRQPHMTTYALTLAFLHACSRAGLPTTPAWGVARRCTCSVPIRDIITPTLAPACRLASSHPPASRSGVESRKATRSALGCLMCLSI